MEKDGSALTSQKIASAQPGTLLKGMAPHPGEGRWPAHPTQRAVPRSWRFLVVGQLTHYPFFAMSGR
jgi:hypothetical protein